MHWADKSDDILSSHGRCERKCARTLVGCVRNARSGDVRTCMRRYANICISARKAARDHAFRVEMSAELVRRRRVATLVFRSEKRHEPFSFLTECIAENPISLQNAWVQQPFQSKTEGPEVLHVSHLSQRRDLANPLGVEPLSL